MNDSSGQINNTPVERWDVYTAGREATGRSRARGEVFGEDEYHLGTAAWIMGPDGRVLIARRALHRGWNPGKWEVPGGHVLSGEGSVAAAIREIREETGLRLAFAPDSCCGKDEGCGNKGGENKSGEIKANDCEGSRNGNGKCGGSGDCGATLIGTYLMMPDRMLCDVWLFKQDVDIADAKVNMDETIELKKATLGEVRDMLARGEFIEYPCIQDELNRLDNILLGSVYKSTNCFIWNNME